MALPEALVNIESFFKNYPFLQECITVSLGVVFGGVVTVLINRGSIRKQCYFELQYKEVRSLIEYLQDLAKEVERLEIKISFELHQENDLQKDISVVESKILGLNELFREKRPLIHKCLTGTMLAESATIPADWYVVFYDQNSPSVVEMTLKETLDADDINRLRTITSQIESLKNQLINSLEKLIFPGWIAAIKRKLKPIKIATGDAVGVWRAAAAARKEGGNEPTNNPRKTK